MSVQYLGFRVSDFGFRVEGLGFKISVPRVWGLGFEVGRDHLVVDVALLVHHVVDADKLRARGTLSGS